MKRELVRVRDAALQRSKRFSLYCPDFYVRNGETVAIVGPNGSGKSSFLGLLNGSVKLVSGSVEYTWNRARLSASDAQNIVRLIDLSFVSNIPDDFHVADILSIVEPDTSTFSALRPFYRFFQQDRGPESDEIRNLRQSIPKKRVMELSSGNRQLLALAIAVSSPVPVLLVDEVNANLDASWSLFAFDLLKRNAQSKDTVVIMVSHDLMNIAEFADRCYVVKTETHPESDVECANVLPLELVGTPEERLAILKDFIGWPGRNLQSSACLSVGASRTKTVCPGSPGADGFAANPRRDR